MDLTISQMMDMQRELFQLHRDTWPPMEAAQAKEFILYMVEEIGEGIAILKKKGSTSVMENREVRDAFLTEMADVLMYYHEVLLRFQVTPEEISQAYVKKHARNMGRNYTQEYKELYHHG